MTEPKQTTNKEEPKDLTIQEEESTGRPMKLSEYLRQDEVVERFAEIVESRNAMPYIQNVLIAVASSDALQTCKFQSILSSALRAASLRLSVDPSSKQAYLVPFKDQCTLIVGYKGYYDMAVRTGKYRYIHVTKIFQGEEVKENRFSGELEIEGAPLNKQEHIGWMATFVMNSGMSKSIYMSVEEIHEHKQKYSKGWNRPGSAWLTEIEAMERKTVLRRLLTRWGYLDPSDALTLNMIESGEFEEQLYEDIPEVMDPTQVFETTFKEIDPELVQVMIDNTYCQDADEAKELMAKMRTGVWTSESVTTWCKHFMGAIDSEKSEEQAIQIANGEIAQLELGG